MLTYKLGWAEVLTQCREPPELRKSDTSLKPHFTYPRLKKTPSSPLARSRRQQEEKRTHNPLASQQTDPRNHPSALWPRLPVHPELKGPKKPTAEPTSTPLHAPSSTRPTPMFATTTLHSSEGRRSLHCFITSCHPHLLLPDRDIYSPNSSPQHLPASTMQPAVAAKKEKSPPTSLVLASMAPSPLLQHHRPAPTRSLAQPARSVAGYYSSSTLAPAYYLDTRTAYVTAKSHAIEMTLAPKREVRRGARTGSTALCHCCYYYYYRRPVL